MDHAERRQLGFVGIVLHYVLNKPRRLAKEIHHSLVCTCVKDLPFLPFPKTSRLPGSELSSSPSGPASLRVGWVFSKELHIKVEWKALLVGMPISILLLYEVLWFFFSSTVYYFAHAQAGKPEESAGENYRSSSYLRLNLINLASYWVYLADFHSSCLKLPIK